MMCMGTRQRGSRGGERSQLRAFVIYPLTISAPLIEHDTDIIHIGKKEEACIQQVVTRGQIYHLKSKFIQ